MGQGRRGDHGAPVLPEPGSPAATGPPAEIQRNHVRGSSLLVLGRVVSLLLGMATHVVIVRELSKTDFGAFSYAIALAHASGVLLSLGQGRLLSRFLAKYEEERDYPRMFGAMVLAAGTILVTSTVLITAMYAFAGTLIEPAVDGDDAVRLVLILILLSPLEALDQVFVSLFAVFSKPTSIFFRKHVVAPGLRLVVVLLLVLTDAGVTFVAVGYVLAALAGLMLYLTLLVRVLRERGLLAEFRPSRVIIPFRAVFGFSFPLITGELVLLSMTVGGVIVLGWYHSMVEVANYRAVFSSARLNTAVTASFSTLFLPVLARLHARGDLAGLRSSYWHTAAFVAVFSFPIFALTGPLGATTTVVLFGERYAESAPVLSILAVGYYVNVMLGFNAYALQVSARIRYLVGVNLVTALTNIGVCLLLAPKYAAVGIALGNCTALLVQNLLNQWALRKAIGTSFIDPDHRACYLTIVGAAAGLWLFQVLVSPGLVVSLLAAAAASLLVLLGSRRVLHLGSTFPELLRVPLLRRIVQ